jgi:hypothetical protein
MPSVLIAEGVLSREGLKIIDKLILKKALYKNNQKV